MFPPVAEHEHIQNVELLPFFALSVFVIIQNLKVLGITRTVSDFDGLLFKKKTKLVIVREGKKWV